MKIRALTLGITIVNDDFNENSVLIKKLQNGADFLKYLENEFIVLSYEVITIHLLYQF